MQTNCSCPGCCYLVPMGTKYCAEHAPDARHQRPPKMVHDNVYQSRIVSYPTTVGHPEHGKNKI